MEKPAFERVPVVSETDRAVLAAKIYEAFVAGLPVSNVGAMALADAIIASGWRRLPGSK